MSGLPLSHQPLVSLPAPSPKPAHLVLRTLDYLPNPQLTLCTAALRVVLMCKLEHSTPSAHFKVFDGSHRYHKL